MHIKSLKQLSQFIPCVGPDSLKVSSLFLQIPLGPVWNVGFQETFPPFLIPKVLGINLPTYDIPREIIWPYSPSGTVLH